MASKRTATFKVYKPTHVPNELHGVWHESAKYLANRGKLLTASGKVDYYRINNVFKKVLAAYERVAAQRGKNAREEAPATKAQRARKASARVYKPSHVPDALKPVWNGAAQHLSLKGRLLEASGRVNYAGVNKMYRRALKAYITLADEAGRS